MRPTSPSATHLVVSSLAYVPAAGAETAESRNYELRGLRHAHGARFCFALPVLERSSRPLVAAGATKQHSWLPGSSVVVVIMR
jgi:hypothetical protein